jgi:two-component system sensor histidine kinase KdpD
VADHGHYKIFLGMAAGVGKTFRMLQEGRAVAETGRDVVVGLVETHGREETAAQADGLEVVPRRRVSYRGTRLEEMDLPGILRRAPELVLVDELAHTNAPGVEHGKRYEDIAEILEAGIDVFSTVNVQHLESLNDQVAELTGVRVRESVPDRVLGTADEVVLLDLTPEALITRLREGKVYAPARVPAALNGFFKVENLRSLREVALRQVAEDVESKRLTAAPDQQAIAERLMALAKLEPAAERVVRRAWRSAQRLGAELDVLVVRHPETEPSASERETLEAMRRLAAVFGAHLIVDVGDDVAEVAIRVARERGTTYVLLGTPAPRKGVGRFAEPLPMRLARGLPGVDVRMVAERPTVQP